MKIIKISSLILFVFIFSNCKECDELAPDRKVQLTIIDSTTLQDISSTLINENFHIWQTNTPGIQSTFKIEFGLAPLLASIPTRLCKKSSSEKFSDKYGIWKNQQIIGFLEIDFIKVKNECKECIYSFENIELIDIEGEIVLQEFDNRITLIVN